MTFYNDIKTLPLLNYIMLSSTGDLRYLAKSDELPTIFNFNKLNLIWEDLQKQIQDKNGVSDEAQIILEKQRDVAILYCEVVGNNNKSLLSTYNKVRREYESMIKSNDVSRFDWFDHVSDIEMVLGFQINLKDTPVAMYLSYVKKAKKINGRKSD
jgi:hypothetical protein